MEPQCGRNATGYVARRTARSHTPLCLYVALQLPAVIGTVGALLPAALLWCLTAVAPYRQQHLPLCSLAPAHAPQFRAFRLRVDGLCCVPADS